MDRASIREAYYTWSQTRQGLHVHVSIKTLSVAFYYRVFPQHIQCIHVHVPEIGWLEFFVKYYTSFRAIPTYESKDSMI